MPSSRTRYGANPAEFSVGGAGVATMSSRLLVVLALLSAVSSIATDLYLASFPEVISGLHTTAAATQWTLTAFLVGLGIGQPVWGPISDRFGRRAPLLLGAFVATVASGAAVMAPSIQLLVLFRFVQALAAASGVVIARAVVADLTRGFAGARAMTLLTTVTATAPVVAPMIGGALAGHFSWRGVLGVIAVMTLISLGGVLTTVRETHPPVARASRLSYRRLGSMLRRPAFMAYALTQSCAFGAIMGYISNSSLVYQSVLGVSSLVYGLGFAVNACGSMTGGFASARLARRHVHPARTVRHALPCLFLSAVCVLLASLSPWPGLLVVPLFGATLSMGFIMGNCMSLAIEQARDAAGAGSAVLGGLMFFVGALSSSLGALGGGDSAVPMGCIMTAFALAALACFTVARRYVALHPGSEVAFAAP